MTQLADDNFICGCTGGVLKVQWCETDGVTNDVTVQRGLLPTHTTLASLPVHSQDHRQSNGAVRALQLMPRGLTTE